MVAVKDLGNSAQMTREVALGPLGDATTAL